MTAKQIIVKCKDCTKICHPALVPFEIVADLPKEAFNAILDMKAVFIYCKRRKEAAIMVIEK